MPFDLDGLVSLCQLLGNPLQKLTILAEGNASMKDGEDAFWVKASGISMVDIGREGFVRVDRDAIRSHLDRDLNDVEVRDVLRNSCTEPTETRMPSVETFMHAYLLSLPGVEVVAHTHPDDLLPVLCRPDASLQASRRYFPDEIVCCGPSSAFVPYSDPGLPLARAIREAVIEHTRKEGQLPRTIWLGHHGLIALGATLREAEAATLMTAKAARLRWQSMFQATPLPKHAVKRIHSRPDEHYRQKLINEIELSRTSLS